MGMFDKIKDAIWGKSTASAAPSPTSNPQKPIVTASVASGPTPKPAPDLPVASATSAPTAPSPTPKPAPDLPVASATSAPTTPSSNVAAEAVDVAAMLDDAVMRKGRKLDWRRSIVDLMKALDLDSSQTNRKALAKELNYEGSTANSAAMNIWLHKALMKKLAESGGRVPPELMD